MRSCSKTLFVPAHSAVRARLGARANGNPIVKRPGATATFYVLISADAAARCHTCRTNWVCRCMSALRLHHRHSRKRTRKTSWPAWSNRSADISCPSNLWSAPGFRCRFRTSRNETRKSAWRKNSRRSEKAQGVWRAGAAGLMARRCSSNQSAKIGKSFSMPGQPCCLPSRTTSFASTPTSLQRLTNCSA